MKPRAKIAIAVVVLALIASCAPTPQQSKDNTVHGALLVSFARTEVSKATKKLSLDASKAESAQLAIAVVLSYSGAHPALTPPKGWTVIQDNAGLSTRQSLYWHIVGPDEDKSPTWTFNEAVDAQGALLLLSNFDSLDPVDASSGNVSGPLATKSVTTTSDGDLILAFFATNFDGPNLPVTMPQDMNMLVAPDGKFHQYWVLGAYLSGKGATQDIECPTKQGVNWAAAQVAIRRSSKAPS